MKSRDLKFGQVVILTNSRFSVLSSEEEGEIVEAEEEEVETKHVDDDALRASVEAKEKEIVIPRQSLPRDSKIKHKVLGDKSVQKAHEACPSELNKKKSRHH